MGLFKKLRESLSKEQRVVKGKEAAYLSSHFLTDEYVENVLFRLFSEWITTEIDQTSEREKIYQHAQSIQGFKKYLNDLETDKKMIERESPS
jgi:hypothetical protein